MTEAAPADPKDCLERLARHLARLASRAERDGLDEARDLLQAAERALRKAPRDEG